jgi:hypothetical protein
MKRTAAGRKSYRIRGMAKAYNDAPGQVTKHERQ